MKDKQKLTGYQENGTGFTRLVIQGSGLWSVVKMNLMVWIWITLFSGHILLPIIARQPSLQRSSPRKSAFALSNRRLLEFEEKSSHRSLWHFFRCEQILSGGTVQEENYSVISAPVCSGVDVCHFLVPMNECETRFWASKVQYPQLKKYLSHSVIKWRFFLAEKKGKGSVPVWWMVKNISCNILQLFLMRQSQFQGRRVSL